MDRPRIHLIAPAGVCRPFLDALRLDSARALIQIVQKAIGAAYLVTGDEALIEASENERSGGRRDDERRAADIQESLTDNHVVCVIALRGGAWFTRILPMIDFSVLPHRAGPVAVFGFSELTTLVNIVGSFENGLGIYDMGPAFLTYGLKRHATSRMSAETTAPSRTSEWVDERLRPEFEAFFHDVISMIEGRGSSRPVTARIISGSVPDRFDATFAGGNLTVLSTMVGSVYDACVRPAGGWLLVEDFNDKLERIDRFLAHLTLSRYWDRCQGVLLGDFHKGYEDLIPAVLELLPSHIPPGRSVPILHTGQIGHVWPMSPLPLHVAVTVERIDEERVALRWPPSALRTV